jgi:hypothetical protein
LLQLSCHRFSDLSPSNLNLQLLPSSFLSHQCSRPPTPAPSTTSLLLEGSAHSATEIVARGSAPLHHQLRCSGPGPLQQQQCC